MTGPQRSSSFATQESHQHHARLVQWGGGGGFARCTSPTEQPSHSLLHLLSLAFTCAERGQRPTWAKPGQVTHTAVSGRQAIFPSPSVVSDCSSDSRERGSGEALGVPAALCTEPHLATPPILPCACPESTLSKLSAKHSPRTVLHKSSTQAWSRSHPSNSQLSAKANGPKSIKKDTAHVSNQYTGKHQDKTRSP